MDWQKVQRGTKRFMRPRAVRPREPIVAPKITTPVNDCRIMILRATRSNKVRATLYLNHLKEMASHRQQLNAIVDLLYLKLPLDIVSNIFPSAFVRSFNRRLIRFTPTQITINIGHNEIIHDFKKGNQDETVMSMLHSLISRQLLNQVFDIASLHSQIRKDAQTIANKLIGLISAQILKNSTIILPASFPSRGHPNNNPVPPSLLPHADLIQTLHVNLTLYPSATSYAHYYPGELYSLQRQISSVKSYFPSAKTVHITVTEITSALNAFPKIYLAKSDRSSVEMIGRMFNGGFADEEKTTVEDELEELRRVLGAVPGLVATSVELRRF